MGGAEGLQGAVPGQACLPAVASGGQDHLQSRYRLEVVPPGDWQLPPGVQVWEGGVFLVCFSGRSGPQFLCT